MPHLSEGSSCPSRLVMPDSEPRAYFRSTILLIKTFSIMVSTRSRERRTCAVRTLVTHYSNVVTASQVTKLCTQYLNGRTTHQLRFALRTLVPLGLSGWVFAFLYLTLIIVRVTSWILDIDYNCEFNNHQKRSSICSICKNRSLVHVEIFSKFSSAL